MLELLPLNLSPRLAKDGLVMEDEMVLGSSVTSTAFDEFLETVSNSKHNVDEFLETL